MELVTFCPAAKLSSPERSCQEHGTLRVLAVFRLHVLPPSSSSSSSSSPQSLSFVQWGALGTSQRVKDEWSERDVKEVVILVSRGFKHVLTKTTKM
ncbi:hypothetical protein NQZ68_018459 [Dissostichus eleginoides]|nr:hypothetical protein NQZ68_018459 [Dissostichus eleginoides]